MFPNHYYQKFSNEWRTNSEKVYVLKMYLPKKIFTVAAIVSPVQGETDK